MLVKRSLEQIEEEGGNEELDSKETNKWNLVVALKQHVLIAKKLISNYYCNITNLLHHLMII